MENFFKSITIFLISIQAVVGASHELSCSTHLIFLIDDTRINTNKRTVGNGVKSALREKMSEKLFQISSKLNLSSTKHDQDVRDFLNTLSERDRNIFKMRFDDPPKASEEVAHKFGLSELSILDIENRLLEDLRKYFEELRQYYFEDQKSRTIENGIKPDINLRQSSREKMNEKLSKISPDLNLNSITHDRDVRDFLKTLSERDQNILEMRFDDPPISQSKVGRAIGLSQMRIFYIENQRLEELRGYFKGQGRTVGNGIKPGINLAQSSREIMNGKLSKISPELNLSSITHDRDVRDFLKTLSEGYRNILEMRFDDPPISQSNVGRATGLLQPQVFRIENQLLEELRRYLKRQGRTIGNGIKPDINLSRSPTEKMNKKLSKISPDLNLSSITHDRDVRDFLKTLSERDRNILEMRFEDPPISQSKVGRATGLSQERILYIENQLLEELRRYLKRQGHRRINRASP